MIDTTLERMSRLLIIGKFPYPNGAAASVRIKNLAEGFVSNGWAVDVVNFGVASSDDEVVGPKIEHRLLYPLPKGKCWPEQWALFVAPRLVAQRLSSLCADRDYRAAYVYGRAASINAPLFHALKRADVCIINDINESPEHFYGKGGRWSPNYWNGWLGYHRTALQADLITGISQEICAHYEGKGISAHCIPSVENYEGMPSPFPQWQSDDGPELLYLGAMFERDRPDWMLRILGILAQRGAPFKLNLIGGYSKRPSALKLLAEVMAEYPMLEGRVVQYGRVSDDELQRLMSDSALCFVLRRDHIAERCSFPTRLVECLKAGRCVISSNVPDVPNYLTHGENAILLGQESLERDADVLREFFDDPLRIQKLAEAGREQAEIVFCAKQHTARLIDRIASL
jgi:glycosyltransferase involved in cell wall biosynthesis